MALIKQANANDLTKSAIVLDLGDLRRQGEALIDHARNQAAAIVRAAEAERDRLIAGADQRGHAEGLARGLEEGRATGHAEGRAVAMDQARHEAAAVSAAWEAAATDFAAKRDTMFLEARTDILRLALLIAEKVTKRTVAIDPDVAAAQVESVLALIARPTEVVVLINPDDRPTVEHTLPGVVAKLGAVRAVELVDDPALERGSCIARMRGGDGGAGGRSSSGSGGEIDATISTQLDRIIAALLPSAGTGEEAAP